jgi:hypothetical protein
MRRRVSRREISKSGHPDSQIRGLLCAHKRHLGTLNRLPIAAQIRKFNFGRTNELSVVALSVDLAIVNSTTRYRADLSDIGLDEKGIRAIDVPRVEIGCTASFCLHQAVMIQIDYCSSG